MATVTFQLKGDPTAPSCERWRTFYFEGSIYDDRNPHGLGKRRGFQEPTSGEQELISLVVTGFPRSSKDDERRRRALWDRRFLLHAVFEAKMEAIGDEEDIGSIFQAHLPVSLTCTAQEEASTRGFLKARLSSLLEALREDLGLEQTPTHHYRPKVSEDGLISRRRGD